MLCNILEGDIGVSRDLVKNNKTEKKTTQKKKKVDQICTVSIVPDFFKFVLKAWYNKCLFRGVCARRAGNTSAPCCPWVEWCLVVSRHRQGE